MSRPPIGSRRLLGAAVLLAALACACRDTATPPAGSAVARLTVSPAVDSLAPGESARLSVAAEDSGGRAVSDARVLWSSSAIDVATVDSTGQVRALAPGRVVIAATSSGVRGEASVVVRRVPASLQVQPASIGLGETVRLQTVLRDSAGVAIPGFVAIAIPDTSVLVPDSATIAGGSAVATARAIGTAVVSASVGGRTLTTRVTVGPPRIAHVVFPHAEMVVPVGVDRPLDVGVFVAGAGHVSPIGPNRGRIDWPVTFESADPAVASVDPRGTLRGVGPGTTTITATSGGVTGSVRVRAVALAERPVFTAISTGSRQTCALSTGGIAYCWGDDLIGQLGLAVVREQLRAGTGTYQAATLPLPVRSPVAFTRLAVSNSAQGGCALTAAGEAWCWRSPEGALLVSSDLRFVSLSMSVVSACGLTADGRAYCWRVGYGTEPGTGGTEPKAVGPSLRFATIVAGGCGLTLDGDLYCWDDQQPIPQRTGVGRKYKALFPGVCAITVDDATYCGGTISSWLDAPDYRVDDGHVFVAASASDDYGCGLERNGTVWCWPARFRAPGTPQLLAGAPPLRMISVAEVYGSRACGLTPQGTAYCWGQANELGELGVPRVDVVVTPPPGSLFLYFRADHRTPERVLGQP